MSSSVMLFRFVGETIDGAVNSFVIPAVGNLTNSLGPLAVAGVTLYLLIMSYMMMGGYLTSPVSAVLKQLVKFAIIATFALNSGNYMEWVVGALEGLQAGLASAVQPGTSNSSTIYEALDRSLDRSFTLVGECLSNADEAGMHIGSALGWLFSGLSIGIGALLFALIGGAIVMTAKLALGIMFGVGPLFIMCLMWPATARFFDAWFSQVLNYTLTIVFASVVMTFANAAFDHFIAAADVSANGINSPAFAALQILGLTGILSYLLLQVGGMASGLAGGVSAAAMSLREMASPITSAARAASTGAASVNDIANPVSTRLDPKTGLQTTSRRFEHVAMGRTLASPNPAYRRAVMDQFRQSMGIKNGVKGSEESGGGR
ncbi:MULTISPECIES: type IV secretion system protein [unclassified Pseudoxanthomonas]|uniref:type IV secretion system protein n=1 Tax=unclassified Pseudoxanthomonas TaxID=2645906 RepID=UPI00307F1735